MTYGSTHPLDTDLADLAIGAVETAQEERLEEHLAECLLCRIKMRRLREALELQSSLGTRRTAGGETPFRPSFLVPTAVPYDAVVGGPAPGEIWAAGQDERILVVLVRRIDDRYLVAPASFDVLSADDETLVVSAERSPFSLSLAVYPKLAKELPGTLLTARFGSLVSGNEVDRLFDGSLPGTQRGTPIEGPTDPRLEFRQMLADHLGQLEEVQPDPGTSADGPPPRPNQVASSLASNLRQLRGPICTVRALFSWDEFLTPYTRGWQPVATVDELGTVLVVFDTPAKLASDADFDGAMSVLTRFNGSAIVVLATALSDTADVFDAPSLSYGIGVPSGDFVAPRPLLSELAPADAISKFLEDVSGTAIAWSERTTMTAIDVFATLSNLGSSALTEVVNQGRRAHIVQKIAGYSSVEELRSQFDEVLRGALSGLPVAERLSELAEGGNT